jgi:uncharacterized protein Yka (UPF0111/DUF47 family)
MRRWFLPESPDLLGLLGKQGEITIAAMDALCAWSGGDRSAAATVHALEHDGDQASREVLAAVKSTFVTPISPEDIYELSERLDHILNSAKNLVRESELVAIGPDAPMVEMAKLAALGVRSLVLAFPALSDHPDSATGYADEAVRQQRAIEHVYRKAMSALLAVDDVREVAGRRELYRRCARMGDAIEGVAHRIWYAVVKQG